MEQYLSILTLDELTDMYHKINADLTKEFLNRVPWEEQQERINNLSKISQELSRRNLISKAGTDSNNSNGEVEMNK